MKSILVVSIALFSSVLWARGPHHLMMGGAACNEKSQLMYSARKSLDYCLQAWNMFVQPTDQEPDTCAPKLKAYENGSREYRACLKALRDENANNAANGPSDDRKESP